MKNKILKIIKKKKKRLYTIFEIGLLPISQYRLRIKIKHINISKNYEINILLRKYYKFNCMPNLLR